MINAPSLANCDFMTLPRDVDELVASGVEMLHIDLMDGHYVPNLCFPLRIVSDLRRAHPHVQVDVHLMVEDPEDYVDDLAAAGATHVSFHADSTRFVRRTLDAYRARGIQVGVAINPSMPVDVIQPYARFVDYVVLMTVEPGFAGQRFLDGSLERLDELAALRTAEGADFQIEIDGGVDHEVGAACLRRGAEILVTGVYAVFDQPDGIPSAVERFERAMAEAVVPQTALQEA